MKTRKAVITTASRNRRNLRLETLVERGGQRKTPTDLVNAAKVKGDVRKLAAKLPTYVTLKDVKKRWGHGQEDIFPVAQFEKLWTDMTALSEINCQYLVVPRVRG